ncbi:MAG: TolC family protein [Elusimicrobia bacterium]|nr:TolC family protein [Elusimicrobiota bacterium]
MLSAALLCAAATLAAAAAECPALHQPSDVLVCALENHPDVRIARAGGAEGAAFESLARQRPNPELANQSVWGKNGPDRLQYSELHLTHTFELGGKRAARLDQAAGLASTKRAALLGVRERVYLETWLALLRLRQLRDEIGYLSATLGAYARIIERFRARPRLAPEQDVSLGLFEMAENDYRMKRTALEGERLVLAAELERALGRALPDAPELLPARRRTWPSLTASSAPVTGAAVKTAEAEVSVALAGERAAKGAAWPDLKLGPTFQSQRQGGQDLRAFGNNLSLVLPLYHRNGGGREAAGLALRRTEIAREAVILEARDQRSVWSARYQAAVAALGDSLSAASVADRDARKDRLFEQGLITVPLVLEAHRQRLEWTSGQHEAERVAAEALIRVRALDGRLFEEGL